MNNGNNEDLNMDKTIDVDYQNANNMNGAFDNGGMNTGYNNQDMNYGMNHNSYQNQGMNNGMNMNYNQDMHNSMNNGMNMNYNQDMHSGMNNGMDMNYNQDMHNGMNSQYQNQDMNNGMGYNNQNYGAQNTNMGYNQSQGINNGMGSNYGQQQQMQQGYAQNNNMNQGYGQSNMNMGGYNQDVMVSMQNNQVEGAQLNAEISEYKQRLRGMRDVQALTSEVDIQNTNSIINFGQKASDNISKISDELLNSMKAVKSEEASEMLSNLTKIMDKFDVKELENAKQDSMLSKLFKSAGNTVAKLFQKYDSMGYEVQKVYVLLKKYETDIKAANMNLKKLYDGNLEFYRILEKYIVAGEMALEEIDRYITQIPMDDSMNEEEKRMLIQKLEISKEMLSQRVYDLQIAENVAIQAAPMLQTIQMSNFNLMRKINSSFIVTLPIFKQCLAQAVILKRQEIQAKSIKQLDDKTNELIMRNAANTARQSVEIAKMASGSSVAIETLEKSFDTIMKGIEDTKAIQQANAQQRKENAYKLENIKANMKRNIAEA